MRWINFAIPAVPPKMSENALLFSRCLGFIMGRGGKIISPTKVFLSLVYVCFVVWVVTKAETMVASKSLLLICFLSQLVYSIVWSEAHVFCVKSIKMCEFLCLYYQRTQKTMGLKRSVKMQIWELGFENIWQWMC